MLCEKALDYLERLSKSFDDYFSDWDIKISDIDKLNEDLIDL